MGVRNLLLLAASALGLLACSTPGGNGGEETGAHGIDGNAGGDGEAGNDGGVTEDSGPARVNWVLGVEVATLAGSSLSGLSDGSGQEVRFNNPVNVERSPTGELFVADFDNHVLRRSDNDGNVTTKVASAQFVRPFGLVFTQTGRLFAQTDATDIGAVTNDSGALWEIDTSDYTAKLLRSDVGRPRGMVAVEGGLILADPARHVVLRFDPDKDVLTVLAGKAGKAGFLDGSGVEARFDRPYGLAMRDGCVAVADQNNHVIRCVTLEGVVSTIAGTGEEGVDDGPASEARFNLPQDLAADANGNLYVADRGNARVRRIDPQGEVATVAGEGQSGFQDGSGPSAKFFGMEGIDVRPDGKELYVADGNGGDPGPYNRVRIVKLP